MRVVKQVEVVDTKAGKAVFSYEADAYIIKRGENEIYLFPLEEVPYAYLDNFLFGARTVVVDGQSSSDVEKRIEEIRKHIEDTMES